MQWGQRFWGFQDTWAKVTNLGAERLQGREPRSLSWLGWQVATGRGAVASPAGARKERGRKERGRPYTSFPKPLPVEDWGAPVVADGLCRPSPSGFGLAPVRTPSPPLSLLRGFFLSTQTHFRTCLLQGAKLLALGFDPPRGICLGAYFSLKLGAL